MAKKSIHQDNYSKVFIQLLICSSFIFIISVSMSLGFLLYFDPFDFALDAESTTEAYLESTTEVISIWVILITIINGFTLTGNLFLFLFYVFIDRFSLARFLPVSLFNAALLFSIIIELFLYAILTWLFITIDELTTSYSCQLIKSGLFSSCSWKVFLLDVLIIVSSVLIVISVRNWMLNRRSV